MTLQNGLERNSRMSTKEHRQKADDLAVEFSVLTISDTRSAETDSSGRYILDTLQKLGHNQIGYRLVKDEAEEIAAAISQLSAKSEILITTGGTGISRRDTTVDVAKSMIESEIPGFGEIFRVLSFEEVGAASMLSRATAGILNSCILFCLPGSLNAVKLATNKLIAPEAQHLVWELLRK